MEALKRGWLRFRSLPVAAQVVSWVVIGFLVVGLFSESQDLDTETGGTRRSTTTEGPATTEAETTTTTTSSTASTTTTTAAPTTTTTTAQPSGDVVSVTRIVDGDTIEVNSGDKVRLIGIDTPVI